MNRILKSFLHIILFAVIYLLLLQYVDRFTPNTRITFSYALACTVFVSVVEGPFIGGASIALGTYAYQVLTNTFDWMIIVDMALDCILIGIQMHSVKIHEGFFERKDAELFNWSQLVSHIICWVIIYPGQVYFILQKPLLEAMKNGFFQALGYFISCLIGTTLALDLFAQTRISEANFYRK